MNLENLKMRRQFAKKYATAKPALDTTAEFQGGIDTAYRFDILEQAQKCYDSLDYWRDDCRRNVMFVDGDQWGDYTHVFDSIKGIWRHISERALMLQNGCVPMTNNVLIAILRSIMGIFISNQTEPICISRTKDKQQAGEIMTATLQYVYQLNKMWDLDREGVKEFSTLGVKMGKWNYQRMQSHRKDMYFFNIPYDRLFFDNAMEDRRNWDCNIIGGTYDLALVDVLALFAKDKNGNYSAAKAETIKSIYGNRTLADEQQQYDNHTRYGSADDRKDFFAQTGAHIGKCRVIDIWRKERKERVMIHDRQTAEYYKSELNIIPKIELENQRRLAEIKQQVAEELNKSFGITNNSLQSFVSLQSFNDYQAQFNELVEQYASLTLITAETFFDEFVCNYVIADNSGYVMYTQEFDYFPFALKRDLGADGKIHSYVSYFIEQQKSINRNRSIQDEINLRSTKGLTTFDEKTLGENTKEDIERVASKPGAIIFYDSSNAGNAPAFHHATATNTGALQLMMSDLEMIDKISGSSNAVQGMKPNAGTPASLYAQQTQNSVGVLSSFLDSYREFREDRDRLCVRMIQEFYTEEMYVNVHSSKELTLFDPKLVKDVDFEVSIIESQSTPSFRTIQDNWIMQLIQMGLPLEVGLQVGNFTFKDNLIQALEEYNQKQQQAAMQQQQQMQGLPPQQVP